MNPGESQGLAPPRLADKAAAGRAPVTAYIALGANLGDAAAALRWAVQALDGLPLSRVRRASSLYRTAPLDTDSGLEIAAPGNDYLNAVVALQTGLSAPALLEQLQRLELQAGRQRPYRNAPRTLDLDLLLYGNACIDSARLTVPHPRMGQRAFVLVPLAQIAPELVSARQLQAVQHQAIARLEEAWSTPAPSGAG
ncbi:MAG: 2-amino-4-hydroxy-6-hydroxymethyldihydropteridine diphosphokinase [Pseudomonadota bacterium]|nr:2-amino-4-hydroxy-6-hydroxymethyldihydropteridine diphosphokinase [Pseudomonadota bacterium]